MEEQRPQAHFFFGYIRCIRTVQATTQTDDAVEVLALAIPFDCLGQGLQRLLAFNTGVPVGLDLVVKVIAVLAPTTSIKDDAGV